MVIPFHNNKGGNLIENIRKNTWHWLNRTFSTTSCSRIFNFISSVQICPSFLKNPLFLIASHLFTLSIHPFTIYSSCTEWQGAQPIPAGTGLKRRDIPEAIPQCITLLTHRGAANKFKHLCHKWQKNGARDGERDWCWISNDAIVLQSFLVTKKKLAAEKMCMCTSQSVFHHRPSDKLWVKTIMDSKLQPITMKVIKLQC